MVTERLDAVEPLHSAFSSPQGSWHFLHFRESDIKGLEEEFYLLIAQVPSCLTELYLSKYDASNLRL